MIRENETKIQSIIEHQKVLKIIRNIRLTFDKSVEICTKGKCLEFAMVLNEIYPSAELYYNSSHVITKIGDYYYDITGVVNPAGYLPMAEFGFNHFYNLINRNND